MHSGTIRFAGTDLGLYGPVRFSMSRTPDPAPPARAQHWRIEIVVTLELTAQMPATNWAKLRKVQALLAATREGLLEIADENQAMVAWQACPGENSLAEALVQGRGAAQLKFTAMEPVAAEAVPLTILVDPLDGSQPFQLQRCTSWAENIKVNRPDSRNAHRDEIVTSVTFAARTAYADPTADLGTRAAALQAETTRLHALRGKQMRITFPGFAETVQVEALSADPNEGWEYLTLHAQCRYTKLPGDTEAEVKYQVATTTDPTTGEVRTTLSGEIRAPDVTTANAKADGLMAAWRSAGRRVLKMNKGGDYLMGYDSPNGTWLSLKFSIELSEASPDARYSLKIATSDGADGKRITYSGSAYATDMASLLATVALAAGGKYPVELRSELSVDWSTDDAGTLKMGGATFSYEYAAPAGKIRGTINRATSQGMMSDWTQSVTGTLTAPNLSVAQTIARQQVPPGVILHTQEERQTAVTSANEADGSDLASEDVSFEFTYVWVVAHASTAIKYTDTTSPDYTRMTQERTIAGSCWAASQAAAAISVAGLLTFLGVANPIRSTNVQQCERAYLQESPTDQWNQYDFSFTYETVVTGSIGFDIIEAEFTLERTGMVDHKPITEVPLAMPVQQGGFGYNIGRLVASGSCQARTQAAAIAWGQAKRTFAASAGSGSGAEDPPTESVTAAYLALSGTTVRCYSFRFNYSFRYASGLTGLWSGAI